MKLTGVVVPAGVLTMMLALASCQNSGSTTAATNKEPASEVKQPEPPPVVLPAGTVIEARIDQALSTERNRAGDKFAATLDEPLSIGGREELARGTRVEGHVTSSRPSGRLEGRAVIGVTLDALEYKGKMIPIDTTLDARSSEAHKKRNIEVISGGAGIGALIGAIAGGGKGAAIGAAAGAGAGTGVAAASGKFHVEVPAETVFTFKLKGPVELR